MKTAFPLLALALAASAGAQTRAPELPDAAQFMRLAKEEPAPVAARAAPTGQEAEPYVEGLEALAPALLAAHPEDAALACAGVTPIVPSATAGDPCAVR